MAFALEPWNQKCLPQIGEPRKLPVISNRIPVVSGRNALTAILVPKLVAMVTSLCLLCTTVSQMNSPMAHTLSQKQTLHGYVANNWSYGHFCYICAHFGQNLVAVATSHRPVQAAMSSLDWLTTKTPVTSNRILVISSRNAFICIYSNFSPKIGCHGNAPLSLVYGSVTYEFPDSTNPISKPESAWICCIQPGLLTKLANVMADIDIDTFWCNYRQYRYRYFCKQYRRYFCRYFTDTFCCNPHSYL